MVSVKLFGDPNNNFRENVLKFWRAYSGWIQSDKFDYDLVASDNIDEKYGLNVDWEFLYREYISFITTMLTHYTKYQNDNVKHHDTLDVEDVEMIVSMTAIMMKYIKDRLG